MDRRRGSDLDVLGGSGLEVLGGSGLDVLGVSGLELEDSTEPGSALGESALCVLGEPELESRLIASANNDARVRNFGFASELELSPSVGVFAGPGVAEREATRKSGTAGVVGRAPGNAGVPGMTVDMLPGVGGTDSTGGIGNLDMEMSVVSSWEVVP